MSEYTERELIEAIRKNGYPQIKFDLFEVYDNTIYACAAGQALLNLGVIKEEEVIQDRYQAAEKGKIFFGTTFPGWYSRIWRRNDRSGMTCAEIADDLEKDLARKYVTE